MTNQEATQTNHVANDIADWELKKNANRYGVQVSQHGLEAQIIDCGIHARGGINAGRIMAEICLGGLGKVCVGATDADLGLPMVTVVTDHPVQACMASQYAGWKISGDNFFAMASGPMRAAGSPEKLFDEIGFREQPNAAVGILETDKIPPPEVCSDIAKSCNVAFAMLTLIAAPTASLAGGMQVVARSVETAIHKLHELKFDITRIVSGFGSAPLPPVAKNDMAAIGRTNDAILYGGNVVLYVTGDDDSLSEVGKQTPSSASTDFGRPFGKIFKQYDYDFYKIDPLLFSPARVTLQNVETGRSHTFGELRSDILRESFFGNRGA